jgi:hypothetical protein
LTHKWDKNGTGCCPSSIQFGIERYANDIVAENMQALVDRQGISGRERYVHNYFIEIENDRCKTFDSNSNTPTTT